MANYANILAQIAAAIYSNDNEEITGDVLQVVLNDMVGVLGQGYQFAGIASPSTVHGSPDAKVWYLAPAGTYTNFGASPNSPAVVKSGEIGVFRWDTVWTREIMTTVEIVNNFFDGGVDRALSAEAGKLLAAIIGYQGEPMDLTPFTERTCSLGPSSWYYDAPYGKHIAIPVTPGDRINLRMVSYNGYTTGEYTGWYVFVTSAYDPPYTNGATVPSTGTSARLAAPLGQVVPLEVPENAAFLILTTQDGSGVAPVWEVLRMVVPTETVFGELERLSGDVHDLELTVGGNPQEITATWGNPRVSSSRIRRVFWICNSKSVLGGVITVKLSDYNDYKVGVVIQDGTDWGSTVISDTGWQRQNITKTISAAEAGHNIRVTVGKVADADITVEEAVAVLSQLSYVYTAGVGGLIERVENLEDASLNTVSRFPFDNNGGSSVYAGRKVDVSDHRYTYEALGALVSTGQSRQGGAVFGDYLFQCHSTNNAVVVFKLSTGEVVQTINLTANADNHANSASFGGQYYDDSDTFPCFYISSEGESKVYVYRITGTEGAFAMTLVQELSYTVPYYYPNLHVDAPNNRGVVVGYAANSWQNPESNKMMCCCFDLPDVGAGGTMLSDPYNEFSFPFLYAQQSAFGRYGKLYHAFGNTGAGLGIGGIVIVDYILHNVESFIDLSAVGNLEPEALGIYDDGLVFSTQQGRVIQITFTD